MFDFTSCPEENGGRLASLFATYRDISNTRAGYRTKSSLFWPVGVAKLAFERFILVNVDQNL